MSTGSIVVAHGLSCSKACEIFPDQGLNLYLLYWQVGFFTTELPGKPSSSDLIKFSPFTHLINVLENFILVCPENHRKVNAPDNWCAIFLSTAAHLLF